MVKGFEQMVCTRENTNREQMLGKMLTSLIIKELQVRIVQYTALYILNY